MVRAAKMAATLSTTAPAATTGHSHCSAFSARKVRAFLSTALLLQPELASGTACNLPLTWRSSCACIQWDQLAAFVLDGSNIPHLRQPCNQHPEVHDFVICMCAAVVQSCGGRTGVHPRQASRPLPAVTSLTFCLSSPYLASKAFVSTRRSLIASLHLLVCCVSM